MEFWDRWRPLMVFGPIAALFLIGLIVSLRSGVADLGDRKNLRLMMANTTSVLLRLVGYTAGLMAVQRLIGVRIDFGL